MKIARLASRKGAKGAKGCRVLLTSSASEQLSWRQGFFVGETKGLGVGMTDLPWLEPGRSCLPGALFTADVGVGVGVFSFRQPPRPSDMASTAATSTIVRSLCTSMVFS